jgi:hypothetical protein
MVLTVFGFIDFLLKYGIRNHVFLDASSIDRSVSRRVFRQMLSKLVKRLVSSFDDSIRLDDTLAYLELPRPR